MSLCEVFVWSSESEGMRFYADRTFVCVTTLHSLSVVQNVKRLSGDCVFGVNSEELEWFTR